MEATRTPYKDSPYFYEDEVHCRCGREDCDALEDPPSFMLHQLEQARRMAGIPFPISSWIRCWAHNEDVGGSKNSTHPEGIAVDIKCRNSKARWRMVEALMFYGFSVIVYSSWIHADKREKGPIFLRGQK